MSAKESSGGREKHRVNRGARLGKPQKNLVVGGPCPFEEGRPKIHRHRALPVSMEGGATEAVSRPIGKTVKREDVVREQLAVEDDVEHEMHDGTAEVAPEERSPGTPRHA